MTDLISARAIQALLGAVYASLACVAVARSESIVSAIAAIAMMLGAYVTGRTVPDIYVRRNQLLQVAGFGFVVILAGTISDITGGSQALGWASIVMAYCAGNRLRAAGVGPAL